MHSTPASRWKTKLLRLAFTALVLAITCLGQANGPPADNSRDRAVAFEQEGHYSEAEAAWRAVLMAQPENSEAYAHLGFLEAHEEHYKEAISLYRKALTLSPLMPGLQMNLGLALFKAGDFKQAIYTFTPLRKSESPQSAEAQRLTTLIGMSYFGLDEFAAAVPYLKQVTAADPQNLPFRLVLAHSCLASRQFQCVLDTYHEILLLNAESAEADMLAGEAMDEMQDHEGATQQFRAAVKVNPQEPNVHFGLGYLLWTQGQYEEAAKEFQAELANVPDNAQALTYLADADMKTNNSDAALPLLKKAVQISPAMELAHLDLGIFYSDAGKQQDALREFKAAARLAPADVKPHYRLARLYQTMGRKDEANAEFQKTKTLNKSGDDSLVNKMAMSKMGNSAAKTKRADGNAPDPSPKPNSSPKPDPSPNK
jgi:tetratricopeptide (TPR) repeat protein